MALEKGIIRKTFQQMRMATGKGAARLGEILRSNMKSRTMGQTPHGFKRMLHSHMLSKRSKKTFIHPQHRREQVSEAASPTYARRQGGT